MNPLFLNQSELIILGYPVYKTDLAATLNAIAAIFKPPPHSLYFLQPH